MSYKVEEAIEVIEREIRKMADKTVDRMSRNRCEECGGVTVHHNAYFCKPCANVFYKEENE